MPPTGRRRRLPVIAVAVAVVVGGGYTAYHVAMSRTPPPLPSGEYRVYLPDGGNSSVPQYATALVANGAGDRVGAGLGWPADRDTGSRAEIWFGVQAPPPSPGVVGRTRTFTVHPGDRLTVFGLDVTIVHVWDEPDWRNDAVDFRAEPAG